MAVSYTHLDVYKRQVGYVYTKYITAGNKVIDASNIDESNTVSLDVKATAYAGDTITSTGTVPTEGTTIAVDPSAVSYTHLDVYKRQI